MDFKGFTEEQLQLAREYATEVHQKLADEVFTADYYADHVTYKDKERIKQQELETIKEILSGNLDLNFTVR